MAIVATTSASIWIDVLGLFIYLMNLFSEENKRESIQFSLPDANISYYPSFFSSEEATRYFKIISEETPWQQDTIKIFGKVYDQP